MQILKLKHEYYQQPTGAFTPLFIPFCAGFSEQTTGQTRAGVAKNLPPATLAFCTFPRSALWEISLKGIYLSPCK